MRAIVCYATVIIGLAAQGAEFAVPQGGGTLPTIALVECMADANTRASGQYCRTTYDCAGNTGPLWEGMGARNGRRVTSEADAIATLKDCRLTIDDPAKVTFYTTYRPEGPGGEVVGMARSSDGDGGGDGESDAELDALVKDMLLQLTSFLGQCYAVAFSPRNDAFGYAFAKTLARAEKLALEKCANSGCRIVRGGCGRD